MEEEKLISAAQDFLRLNRDYADTQTNFDLMRAVIEREKLDPSNIAHLNRAWTTVKVITRNEPKLRCSISRSCSPTPRNYRSCNASTRTIGAHRRMKIVNDMSSKEMERRMSDFVYQKAYEIVFPSAAPSILTRGDLVRGVAPATRGQTFNDAVTAWRNAVAPHLSPSTARQRESYLRTHVVPRFGDSAPHSLNTPALQQFATDLRKTRSRKTVVNVLSSVFAILDYAGKCGTRVTKVSFADLQLGEAATHRDRPCFTLEQAGRIIDASPEPYKTMFAVAWSTGLRAGDLLALRPATSTSTGKLSA